jgi:alpha-methylacyl-CoA racemase
VRAGGAGQVVDAAIVDGALALMGPTYSMLKAGLWPGGRGENMLDGGSPFGRAYETADRRHVVAAAIEPKFYAAMLEGLGLDPATLPRREDPRNWPALHERLAAAFRTKTRDEWARVFEGRDACVTPVLDMSEAPLHPHNVARGAFTTQQDTPVPAPAPRFSRTPGETAPRRPAESLGAVLQAWGLTASQARALSEAGSRPSAP